LVGQGNLNVNVDYQSKDEIGLLTKSFNQMLENLRSLVTDVKKTIISLESNSDAISNTMGEVSKSSEEVARAVQDIASGATDQAMESSNTAGLARDLANIIDDITEKVNFTNISTEDLKVKNQSGAFAIAELSSKFKENSYTMESVSKDVSELTEKSKSIDVILSTIKSIAGQTNLLALNAAIEAARAGEQGRGFSVVADEIRKLAEQSSRATEEIQKILSDIIDVIGKTNSTVIHAKSMEKRSSRSLDQTTESFENINFSAENISRQIVELSENIKLIDRIKGSVLSSIESISSVAQQTAASSEEIGACAEEQTASVQEITASTYELNNMINQLAESIKLFKL
jgi:methyl-accepting chemotaxis protein